MGARHGLGGGGSDGGGPGGQPVAANGPDGPADRPRQRSSGETFLRRELLRAARYGTPLAVALFDLDGFKEVNDTAGHEAGDEVLRQVAATWRAGVRQSDVVFRHGGDEFVVVLPHTTVPDAEALMARMSRATPHPCSIGITNTVPGDDPHSVMLRADAALYAAKSGSGRGIATTVA